MPNKSKSQSLSDSSRVIVGRWGISYGTPPDVITQWSDSTIKITGDTIKAIKALLIGMNKEMEQYMDQTIEFYDLLGACINWINTVPDIWRNEKSNKAWAKFLNHLRKRGYTIVKSK